MRHGFAIRISHLALAAVAAAAIASCVRPRDIFAPVPGALQRTIADTSVTTVLDAAALAITDRGLTVSQMDRDHGMVESAYFDIAAVRSDIDAGSALGIDRNVRVRFRAIPSFGAISLYGEAVYMLGDFGGRASERMVPEGHPARQVLLRMMQSVDERVALVKAQRTPPPPDR